MTSSGLSATAPSVPSETEPVHPTVGWNEIDSGRHMELPKRGTLKNRTAVTTRVVKQAAAVSRRTPPINSARPPWAQAPTMVISSLSGMSAAAAAPAAAYVLGRPELVPVLIGIALIVLVQHRENFARLRAGTEPKVGRKE